MSTMISSGILVVGYHPNPPPHTHVKGGVCVVGQCNMLFSVDRQHHQWPASAQQGPNVMMYSIMDRYNL